MEEGKIVTVKVTWKTRERLKARGKKGDTYEKIIREMLIDLELLNKEPET